MSVGNIGQVEPPVRLGHGDGGFSGFLDAWCQGYVELLDSVELFDEKIKLTEAQQRAYALYFQHFRGHFFDTVIIPMFRIAKHAAMPDSVRQRVVNGLLGPLHDELGLSGHDAQVHDQLYANFATALGVDADAARWRTECYPECIRSYNESLHLLFIRCIASGWPNVIQALTVYLFLERIDEHDYKTQLRFAERFSLIRELEADKRSKALEFFSVHADITDSHFAAMPGILEDLWSAHQNQIKDAAFFLMRIHHRMYEGLAAAVLAVEQDNARFGAYT
jgi:hypothetical protein